MPMLHSVGYCQTLDKFSPTILFPLTFWYEVVKPVMQICYRVRLSTLIPQQRHVIIGARCNRYNVDF
jgi:hypothetical protein